MIKNMNKNMNYIDGIKGISCLFIALNHFINLYYSSNVSKTLNPIFVKYFEQFPIFRLLYNGNFYVSIFLIVSAFLTSYTLFIKKDNDKYKKTIFKRGFRLAFPLLTICFIIYLMSKLNFFGNLNKLMNITLSSTTDINCFDNLKFVDIFLTPIICLFKSSTKFNFVFWMINILYRGFFISVILTLLVDNRKNDKQMKLQLILLITSTLLIPLIADIFVLFTIGTLFAYLYINKDYIINNKYYNKFYIVIKILSFFIFIIGLYLGSVPYKKTFDGYYTILNFIPFISFTRCHIIGAILVFYCVLTSKTLKKILSIKSLQFLGSISFQIYLIHFPLECSLTTIIFINLYKFFNGYAITVIITLLLHIIILIIISYIYKMFIDKNLTKLYSKISHVFI